MAANKAGDAPIRLTLTEAERDQLRIRAATKRMAMAEYVRDLVRRDLGKNSEKTGKRS